jgi:type II secretion system protein G
MHKYDKKKGFTLIELLVVIAIIGILATIVLVSLNSARQKARDTRRIGDLRQVALALEMYYDDHVSAGYPGDADATLCDDWATLVTNIEGDGYMTKVPADPLNSGSNVYTYNTDLSDYVLKAVLENASNTALTSDVDGSPLGCACADPAYCIQP